MDTLISSLPLGSNRRDISTVVKQAKIIYQVGYTHEELVAFRPIIWRDLLETSCAVVQILRALYMEPVTSANEVRHIYITLLSYHGRHS